MRLLHLITTVIAASFLFLNRCQPNVATTAQQTAVSPCQPLNSKNGPLSPLGHELATLYCQVAADAQPTEKLQTTYNLIQTDGTFYVLVDAVAQHDTDTLALDMKNLGANINGIFGSTISAQVPILALSELASLKSLNRARLVHAITNETPI